MIVVDSSVWIDYFTDRVSNATKHLDSLLGTDFVVVGDLILVEVLQGLRVDADYVAAKALLDSLDVIEMLGAANAIASAENYRSLRKKGATVRKSSDVIIATACIARDAPLLFSDRDFIPFVEHLGLKAAI